MPYQIECMLSLYGIGPLLVRISTGLIHLCELSMLVNIAVIGICEYPSANLGYQFNCKAEGRLYSDFCLLLWDI